LDCVGALSCVSHLGHSSYKRGKPTFFRAFLCDFGSIMIKGIGLLVLTGLVTAGLQENIDRPSSGSQQKHDKIQDEILAAMKDSGVLNEWQDKLDNLLYEANEVENEPKEKNYLSKQDEKMIQSFVEEYAKDKNYKVSSDIVVNIVRRVQKSPSPNLPSIFVQLSPLVDVISAIGQKTSSTSKLQSIIDRQAPVFDSPAKTKDILHTLTENLKSELVRLTLDSPSKAKVPPPPPKKQKKKEKSGLDISDYLTLGSTLLKGGNAGQILSLLSGETDMSSMLTLLPGLIESGNYKDILSKLFYGYIDGSPYGPVVKNLLDSFLNSEQGKKTLASGFHYLEMFVKSESGRRIALVLPKLTTAKDMDTFLELVHKEAEWNWSQVFANIENSDYKETILRQLSEYIVESYEYTMNPPKGSIISKLPFFINGFLISNGIPTYDSKKPLNSIVAIINKSIRLFTTMKLDVKPYAKIISEGFVKMLNSQSKGIKFDDLKTTEKVHLIARLLDSELVSPMQSVWSVYVHSVENLSCARHLLCQVNYNQRQENVQSRIAVVKASSLAAAYALAHVKENTGADYWDKYQTAVWAGAKGDDCMTLYKVKDKTCNIFEWQENNFMSTSYDHIEL